MLQQTQVKTVLARWPAFLARFPHLHALAEADRQAVLQAWQGLGYYRRAHLLHEAARRIVEEYGGAFPQSAQAWQRLPGIGRSTAGAIASIAFGERAPVLDGNVRRVLVRWQGQALAEADLWRLAEAWVRVAPDAGDWNQAMMELGATLCLPKKAHCAQCPAHWCAAREHAHKPLPIVRRPRPKELHLRVELYRDERRGIWLMRRPQGGIWAGLWTPPLVEIEPPGRTPDLVHRLTHRLLHLYAVPGKRAPSGDGRWSHEGDHPMPTGIRRLLARLGVKP